MHKILRLTEEQKRYINMNAGRLFDVTIAKKLGISNCTVAFYRNKFNIEAAPFELTEANVLNEMQACICICTGRTKDDRIRQMAEARLRKLSGISDYNPHGAQTIERFSK